MGRPRIRAEESTGPSELEILDGYRKRAVAGVVVGAAEDRGLVYSLGKESRSLELTALEAIEFQIRGLGLESRYKAALKSAGLR